MWWLLGICSVLLVLLLCPVAVQIEYEEQLTVKVSWLFLRFGLLPQKPKEQKQKKKPEKQGEQADKTSPPQQKKLQVEDIKQILSMVGLLLKSSKKPVLLIMHHLTIKNVVLSVLVSGEDACQTAVRYGQLNAAVYGVLATAKNIVRIKKTKIDLRPDFTGEEEKIFFAGSISICPLFILTAAALFGFSFLSGWMASRKNDVAQQGEQAQQKQKENKEI